MRRKPRTRCDQHSYRRRQLMVLQATGSYRNFRAWLVVVLAFVVGAAALVGVGSTAHAQAGRFAVVFAVGGLGDQSFNDSAYDGIVKAAERFGIDYDYAEPGAVAEYETVLTRFAQSRRYDLIISIGFNQKDAVETVAARFPQQRFAIMDEVAEEYKVASYGYR